MREHRLSNKEIDAFRNIVYGYFKTNGRKLPWRQTKDPYKILVSEIMLQQTQVSRVIEKYPKFIKKFPNIEKLARARLRAIIQVWHGLGYNRRALSLQQLAAIVAHQHSGRIPDDPVQLESLPGIGNATAQAICAFAFNKPAVFVETNIRSVFIHHFFNHKEKVGDAEILSLVRETLDQKHPRRWYSALMDYGTYLKKQFVNPSQRSVSYVRQSPFQGSDRQIRGKILKMLLKQKHCSETSIEKEIGVSSRRLRFIINSLLREGLVRKMSSTLTV